MPQVARLGDSSDHGGTIISASSNLRANGIIVARVGDSHSCPLDGHGVTPIVSTYAPNKKNGGNGIATVGAVAGCGAVIVTGSPNVNANG